MRLCSSRGQAAVETIVTMTAVFGLFIALMAILYFLSLHAYLQYSSHELLLCKEFQEAGNCESKFKQELRPFLKFGKAGPVQSQRSSRSHSMSFRIQFNVLGFQEFTWNYKDQIDLPLQKYSKSKMDLLRSYF